jgi:hypothetical protein
MYIPPGVDMGESGRIQPNDRLVEFDRMVAAEDRIEPRDWMPYDYRNTLVQASP